MTQTVTILTPVPDTAAVEVMPGAPSRRLQRPVRMGLLSNGKPNTAQLLDGIAEVFMARGVEVGVRLDKGTSSIGAPRPLLEQLAADAQLVVNATGD